ncbi:hypothetical protein EYZ11_001475 [Aspergillus tanneri]|uniref:Uncharacterized protein n=1 Tax=Aspergillus tanneri TaxID=1220188 RepID=A0A4S3JUK3_9EURO|nr:hypothetical protein EYZ11_001475 [Aspergillus tanneri]
MPMTPGIIDQSHVTITKK